jgi:hypothetical protein
MSELLQFIPLIITIIGCTAWLVRLEAKILYIEKSFSDDRKELKEVLVRLDGKLDVITDHVSTLHTKVAVLEAKGGKHE